MNSAEQKADQKRLRKMSKVQKRMNRPHRLHAMNRGYEKTMVFLSRGCDVVAA